MTWYSTMAAIIVGPMQGQAAAEQDSAADRGEGSPAVGPARQSSRLISLAWFLAFAVASSIYCLSSVERLSATFDEPGYVVDGLQRWRTGSYDTLMKWGAMPLPIDLATLPLYLSEKWTGHQFDPVADFDRMLAITRATNLVFWWVLLGMAWLAASQIGGRWGGRIAVALLATEPNFLAHAALTTTDVAIAGMLLVAILVYRRGREDLRWSRRVLLPGLWYGVALLAKASALVFGPLCMLAVEIDHRITHGKPLRGEPGQKLWQSWKPWFDEVLRIVGLGFLVILVYVRSDWLPEPTFIKWAQALPQGAFRSVMLWISQHLCIFTNAGEGIVQQIKHNIRGHDVFLLGHVWRRDVWFYFPVALSIKLTEAILFAPLIIAILRPRLMRNWAFIGAAFLLVFSLSSHVQIGVRMMFPLIAIAIVGISAAFSLMIAQTKSSAGRAALIALVVACAGWNAAASIRVWPNALCYINGMWGGVENGYQLISDSNYDWGQGLRELKQWTIANGGGPIDIWYFGTDPLKKDPCFRIASLHDVPVPKDDPKATAQAIADALKGRWIAVSTTLVYGSYQTGSTQEFGHYLQRCKPAARTQTFLIYDFRAGGK